MALAQPPGPHGCREVGMEHGRGGIQVVRKCSRKALAFGPCSKCWMFARTLAFLWARQGHTSYSQGWTRPVREEK